MIPDTDGDTLEFNATGAPPIIASPHTMADLKNLMTYSPRYKLEA